MSRPNSRYFGQVIKKFSEAKRGEQIVVDEQFKASLRQSLFFGMPLSAPKHEVAKQPANEHVLPQERAYEPIKPELKQPALTHIYEQPVTFEPPALDEPVKLEEIPSYESPNFADNQAGLEIEEEPSFWDFLRKYKYNIALVPSMLLLVIVAIQASKLPVQIKTQVLVPTSSSEATSDTQPSQNSQIDQPQDSLAIQGVDHSNADQAGVDQTANSDQPKIKTFPGIMALPASLREKLQKQEATVNNNNYVTGSQLQPQAQNYAQPQTDFQPQPEVYIQNDQQTGQNYQPPVELSQPPVGTFIGPQLPLVQSPQPVSPQVNLQSNPVSNLPQPVQNLEPTYQPVQQSVDQGQTVPVTIPVIVPAPASVSPTPVFVPTLVSPPAPVPVLAPQPLPKLDTPPLIKNYPVYYNANFSNDQKTVFEQQVVAPLASVKPVSYVSVSEDANKVVTVQIYYKDGSAKSVYYQRDSKTLNWNNVQYVDTGYFDNGLQYQPLRK